MNPGSTGSSAVVVSSALALSGAAALLAGVASWRIAWALLFGAALSMLFLWRRAERGRAELESALANERERARSAREQAWQNAFLGQIAEELRGFQNEDDLWSGATTALGRALEASRVVAYEKDSRGVYRLRAQFAADGVAPLDEGASIPGSVVQDRELQARISRSDLAVEEDPELRALAAGLRLRSLVVVPVEREGSLRAAIAVHQCEAPQKWTEGERRFLQRLAEHVAGVLDRAKLSRRLSYEAEVRLGLLRLAQALAAQRDLSSVVEVAVSAGAPLARATSSAILVEDGRGGFRIAAGSGLASRPGFVSISALRPRLDEAVRERSKVNVGAAGGPALTLVPMFGARELMGVFLFACDEPAEPGELDLEAAQSVAEMAAAAMESAQHLEAASTSASALRAHWEDGSDLALVLDESSAIRDANGAASRVLGYTPAELAGAKLETLLAPESEALWRKLEPAILRGARLRDQPLKLRAKDGGSIEVSANASALGSSGRIRLSMIDLTEIRKLEHQLRQSQKLEVLGALAGGIAHDFNNVLGGILGYASLLRTYVKDRPTAAKYVETLERAAVRGAELSGRLLSASRKSPGQLVPVNLNQVVEETLELLAHTLPKGIRIEKRLDPGLHLMMADASQLQQIVLNLCVNARDAMPQGGLLRVATRLLGGAETGEPGRSGRPLKKVQLSVEDTGVGMDAKTLARLFEPFFSTKGEAGTGLGLSVVYGIVKSLGGDVGVKSSPGRGARFEVVLPCRWAEESLVERHVEEVARGQGELILLVDDEKVLRDLGKEILESQGYRVAAVSSGEEALDYLQEAKDVALVILDVVMPGLGGSETYRRLRGVDSSIPVLFSSGLTAEQSVRDLLEGGGAGFVPKPYGIDDLTRAVSSVLRRDNPTLVH
jgi:PAS domain S-box-containing protein